MTETTESKFTENKGKNQSSQICFEKGRRKIKFIIVGGAFEKKQNKRKRGRTVAQGGIEC